MREKAGRIARGLAAVGTLAAWMACGQPPAAPGPPGLPGPVSNAPPVIHSLTSSALPRMEVNQDVTVTADVTDAEVQASKLTLQWSATAGTFTGVGPKVVWRLPKGGAPTPVDVTITLTVIEHYDNADAQGHAIVSENRVSQSLAPFRTHDSDAELSAMGVHFLVDLFGNSSVGPDACLVDFSDTCPGKAAEYNDIVANRKDWLIFSGSAKVLTIDYFGVPKAIATAATMALACAWDNQYLPTGKRGLTSSTCFLDAVYLDRRWWLCASSIDSNGICEPCSTLTGARMMLNRSFELTARKRDAALPIRRD